MPSRRSLPVAVLAATASLLSGGGALGATSPDPQGGDVGSAAIRPAEVHTVPSRIDSSGKTNVSGPLQRFIDGVPDGSTIRFAPGGVYRLKRHGLRLDDRHDLILDGRGAKLKSIGCGLKDSVIVIGRGGSSSDIVIRDFILAGSNGRAGTKRAYRDGCEHQHGVSIHRSSRIEIDDVRIRRTNGDCLYVGGGGFGWSSDVHLHDSICKLTGRQGVAVVAGRRVLVERVRMDSIAINGFTIEPNQPGDGAVDVSFIDNRLGRAGRSGRFVHFLFSASGDLRAPVRGIVVRDNLVTRRSIKARMGGSDERRDRSHVYEDVTFVGNRSLVSRHGPVLTFMHVDGLTLGDNVQPLRSGKLVRLVNTRDVTRV